MPLVAASSDRRVDGGRSAATPLSADLLAREAPRFDVETVLQTGSTNSDLLQRARRAQPQRPVLRAALHQSAGRGRHGRRWLANPGGALLFSLSVPMRTADSRIAAATLACGIGVAEALRRSGVPVLLKWPNDLMLDGRKLGGVLCELALDDEGRRTLVVGVGINVRLDAAARDGIGQPVAELSETAAAEAPRESLIGRMAEAAGDVLQQFDERGFLPLQARFMTLFAQRDAVVDVVELGVRVARGRALGVDGEGRLLIDTGQGIRACSGGEISLLERA